MTYSVFDANGCVGELGTTKGVRDVNMYLDKQEGIPKTKDLFNDGCTTSIEEVKRELHTLKLEGEVREVVENLVNLLNKCDTVAIITKDMTSDIADDKSNSP